MPDLWKDLVAEGLPPRVVTLIGAGGKTTLMYYLVGRLLAAGVAAVATSTTRLGNRPPPRGKVLQVRTLTEALAKRKAWTAPQEPITVVLGEAAGQPEKLAGVPPDWVDELAAGSPETVWLVEGDGAAGRSLKGHRAHEPVIPASSRLVIAVIGADGIRQPLDAGHVHRPERVAELTGVEKGAVLTEEVIARLFFHPEGYLHNCPPGSRVLPFINKVESEPVAEGARRLAGRLLDEGRPYVPGVVLGSLRRETFWFISPAGGGEPWLRP